MMLLKTQQKNCYLKTGLKFFFENNKSIDRLNNTPLTHSEMQQILEQINILKTPLKIKQLYKWKNCINNKR